MLMLEVNRWQQQGRVIGTLMAVVDTVMPVADHQAQAVAGSQQVAVAVHRAQIVAGSQQGAVADTLLAVAVAEAMTCQL